VVISISAIAFACAALWLLSSRNAERRAQRVLAVNLGPVKEDSWYPAWNGVIINYLVTVKGADDQLPKSAYYKPRNRYRAENILDYLEDRYSEYDRVLGITESDISVTKGEAADWGVFGFARLNGKAAVISTYRLKLDNPSDELLKSRIFKVALHEFGHMSGLNHCTVSKSCPMQDAKGKVATVDSSQDSLCDSCMNKAARYAKQVGEA
jgi:predicted Zn-dependent protease